MHPVTIFACDNQPVLIEGLYRVASRHPDLHLVGHAADLGIALAEVSRNRPRIFLLGQPFSSKSILPMVGQLREAGLGESLVIWVCELSETDFVRALQMGARGVVRKTDPVDTLVDCMRVVASGSIYLEGGFRSHANATPRRPGTLRMTPRERQIIDFVCRGMKNKEIAEALAIAPGTVKVHLMHVFEKTGVKDRFQLALHGREFLLNANQEAMAATNPSES